MTEPPHSRRFAALLLAAAALLALCAPASANIGLPMIAVIYPAGLLAIVPVILVEGAVFTRGGVALGYALRWMTIVNLLSTAVGVPLTWAGLLAVQFLLGFDGGHSVPGLAGTILSVTVEAPWLLPREAQYYWMVPTASLVLMVPFFVMSFLVERALLRWGMKATVERPMIDRLCLRANLTSYLLLALVPLGALAYGLARV